jgi:hypothetical protein
MSEWKPLVVPPAYRWLAGFTCGLVLIATFFVGNEVNKPVYYGMVVFLLWIAFLLFRFSVPSLDLNAGGIFGGVAGAAMGIWVLSTWNTTIALTPFIVGMALVGNHLWGLVKSKPKAVEVILDRKDPSRPSESGS